MGSGSIIYLIPIAAMVVLCIIILIMILRIRAELSEKLRDENEMELLSELKRDIAELRRGIDESIPRRVSEIRTDIDRRLSQDATENRNNREEVARSLGESAEKQREALERMSEMLTKRLGELSETQNTKLTEISEKQAKSLNEYQEKVRETLRSSLDELSKSNREKLSEIQGEIGKKLDTSLNERLDASFQKVGEQLKSLYTSLGELSKLENEVTGLNRTLSNVKTRGIFGEAQLESILSNMLPQNLYDKNVVTKKSGSSTNRDAVEFAIKIPDKDDPKAFMYLPIDSKFPATIYDKIQEAAQSADSKELSAAVKELEQFIKKEARDIESKYIDPPNTTDFALMFLPTESLYAEVLRIAGLSEECQNKHHIVITGPSTLSAILSSLSISFRYMAVNRDSKNILDLLSAIKTQYAKLSELIETANKRIVLAKDATEKLRSRTDLINKKLSRVEELEPKEARELLGIEESGDD